MTEGGGDWRPVPDPTLLTTQQLLRELAALRELLEARLNGMDRATELLSATVNRTPTVIQTEISHVREVEQERFASIAQQFHERDVRADKAERAAKEALDAALLAQKELVAQQNDANAAQAAKTDLSTTKQIDQIGIRIDTMQKAFDDRLTELKERIDRGEGSDTGAATRRTEQRLDLGQLIAALAVVAAVIFGILLALKK